MTPRLLLRRAAEAAEAAEAAAECVYMSRGGNIYLLDYQIMCNLFAKVWRIMRNCAVPWTAAHLRYVRLYCAFRHMQGRPCATPRHVGTCVMVILEDVANRVSYHMPTRKFLDRLQRLEMDIQTNVATSDCAVQRLRLSQFVSE